MAALGVNEVAEGLERMEVADELAVGSEIMTEVGIAEVEVEIKLGPDFCTDILSIRTKDNASG